MQTEDATSHMRINMQCCSGLSKQKMPQKKGRKERTPKKTVRNIVPGELSFAEAVAAKQRKPNVDKSSAQRQVTSSNAQQPASNITEEQEVFHVDLNGFATNTGRLSSPVPKNHARPIKS